MFQLLHSLGAKLQIPNEQKLTPLGLAAKLAKKDVSSRSGLPTILPCEIADVRCYCKY